MSPRHRNGPQAASSGAFSAAARPVQAEISDQERTSRPIRNRPPGHVEQLTIERAADQ
ncbi:hypothetical protein AB0D46_24715 [Streptomyces sp. NPDC048383]|uniref:hypothetical protein n=1 Tax=Streptomyces sp. NPDC048383 TaxID=3155386 RepID=UPI003436D86D